MSTPPPHQQKQVSIPIKIVVSILLLAAMAGGVYLTQRGLLSIEEAFDSRSWPTTDATITHSFVHTIETPVKKDGREVPNKKTKSYSPDIAYTYTVKGQELTGTRVTVEDASIGTKASAQAVVDRYPVSKTVKVAYNPDDPAKSLLEPGGIAGSYRWFVPGGILLLIPLLLFRAIWFYQPTVLPTEVAQDENHPLRPKFLNGMLLVEEIVTWEPGQLIHLRRARVGIISVILGAIVTGLILGLVVGLLPAIFFLSGRGVVFIAQCYLAVSAVLALGFAIGLALWGRRREYLIDWALGTMHAEIGWGSQDYPLEEIEAMVLHLPAREIPRNPVVDSYTIQIRVSGRSYTLLECNGTGLSWSETRERLTKTILQLEKVLNVPWTEEQEKSNQPRS